MLAALLRRERTGEGGVVDVSLLRSGTYANGNDLALQNFFGRRGRTRHRTEHESPLYNSYRAADDRWFWLVGLEGSRHWPGVVRALGRADLETDERFATGTARRGHVRELIAEFDAEFARRPLDEWAARFDAEGVWWAPVQTLAEVAADPQAEAVGPSSNSPAWATGHPCGPWQHPSVSGVLTTSHAAARRRSANTPPTYSANSTQPGGSRWASSTTRSP